jgi:hypothetical protein
MIVRAFRFRILAALLPMLGIVFASGVAAQEQPSQPARVPVSIETHPPVPAPVQDQLFTQAPQATTRIVPVEYADTNDLLRILQLFGVSVIANEKPRALVLSGENSAVGLAEDAVRQLDVPPPPIKNVEVIVYLVVATKGGESPQGLEECGPQLAPVMEQLASVFGFEQFGLVDTILLRGRDGSSVEASGFLPPLAPAQESGEELPSNYQVQIDDLQVQSAPGAVSRISLNRFIFGSELAIPTHANRGPNGQVLTQVSRKETGISADLDVQEGQMAVVGKANLSTQGDVVFVVVSAHVVPE